MIQHIHCFGCMFYHQSKIKKSCWFHKTLCYDLYFESDPLNVSNISYLTKHLYIHYDLLSQRHFCLGPLPFYAHYFCQPNTITSLALIRQILQSQHKLFHLWFYQPQYFLIIITFWLSWIIIKVKNFLIVAKIFSFNFVH